MKTIHIETELPTDAGRVWRAMKHPASFLYVCRGLIGVPALVGRTEPMVEDEIGTGWLLLFHVIPFSRHTIHLAQIDEDCRTLRSKEHGGVIRVWNHTLHVEPIDDGRCRYSDTVDIDAGPFTSAVVWTAIVIYRYRQRRWHRLVRKHLLQEGPSYAAVA